jgi:hypothetical protein
MKPWKRTGPILFLLFYIQGNTNYFREIYVLIILKMALRFKKNGICLSTGAGGGEERAERRVEFELRRAITMQSTSNRKVVPSQITTNQNS